MVRDLPEKASEITQNHQISTAKPITQKNQRAPNPKLSKQIGWPWGKYVGYASYTKQIPS